MINIFCYFKPKEWFYDEQDMLEMDVYDEPDPDSDLDYEESYSKRRKKKGSGGRVSNFSYFPFKLFFI